MLLAIDAVNYAIEGGFVWEETPGAFDWLFDVFAQGSEADHPKQPMTQPMSLKSGKPKRQRRRRT